MTNFLTNFGAASWTKFSGFYEGYFELNTFQKSEDLVQFLWNFFDNLLMGPIPEGWILNLLIPTLYSFSSVSNCLLFSLVHTTVCY